MLPLTNKYKFYLYFLFFIFLSSAFNFKFIQNYQNKFNLKNINVVGLPDNEKKLVEIQLNDFQNINIFSLKKDKVLEKLNNFDFLENINVNKIIPSSINFNLSKTSILGKTLINGKKFYIGKNGKLINSEQITETKDLPRVFGKFKVEKYLNLLDILNKYNLDTKNIEKFYYFKNKRWDLVFSNGTIVKLPSKNLEVSLKIYKNLQNGKNFKNTKIIDLRVKDQIILTNKND